MSIAIITDSTCDLGPGAEATYQIDIVPLLVAFGEKVFRDGIDISGSEFYLRLSKAGVLPTTSQPPPAAFQALFRRRLDEGKIILGIFISSGLSGTYQSAMTARSGFPSEVQKRILLIDSMHTTGNMALLVLEACRMRDQGAEAEDICDQITSLIPRVKLYAALESLRYLKMGGRLSAAAAAAGELLLITPIVSCVNGKAASVAKIRRSPNAFRKWLRERLMSDLPDPQYPAVYLHSSNPDQVVPLKEEFRYLLSPEKALTLSIGAVIGTHAGPGARGLSYITKVKG